MRVRTLRTFLAAVLFAIPLPAWAADEGSAPSPDAELLLRKTISEPEHPGRAPRSASRSPDGGHSSQAAAVIPLSTEVDREFEDTGEKALSPPGAVLRQAATALGELWTDGGTWYLPDEGGGRISLDNTLFPMLGFASGRTLIIDPGGRLSAAAAAKIAADRPAYTVLPVRAEDDPRRLLGRALDAAGYASVLRGVSLTFGREASVRLLPDFVVHKDADALLRGETVLISVVPSAADVVPIELRTMAGEHRLRMVEIVEGGAAAGDLTSEWRDPRGTLTTVGARATSLLVAELAATLGLTVERNVPSHDAQGADAPTLRADLRVSRGATSTLFFFRAVPAEAAMRLVQRGEDFSPAWGPRAAEESVLRILERFDIPRIGPVVEFRKPSPSGGDGARFLITVPGWLADLGEQRRLLITPAEIGTPLRLYLQREGIDIFAYRIR